MSLLVRVDLILNKEEILVILLSSICECESESEDEEMVNKMKKKSVVQIAPQDLNQ